MRHPHRPWEEAPPDPGIKPGSIRDRALQAIDRRCWVTDKEDRVIGLFDNLAEAKQAARQAAGGRR
jgi:hypothetical protein